MLSVHGRLLLAKRSLQQRKVKKLAGRRRTPDAPTGVSRADGAWRCQMRALSYIIALVFVLTGPSMAGSADRDMPGVGTFTYCGSPVVHGCASVGGRGQRVGVFWAAPLGVRRRALRTKISKNKPHVQ